MLSYEFYKSLHYFGIVLAIISLAGLIVHAINGGTKDNFPARKLMAISHGVGVALILIAGFGLMARRGVSMTEWPGWILVKLAIWVVVGGLVMLPLRKPALAKPLWFVLPLFGLVAGLLASFSPCILPLIPLSGAVGGDVDL